MAERGGEMMRVNETKEKEAIKALKKLEKIWPSSLWIFAASGTLTVMRKNENGDRAIGGEHAASSEGFSQEYAIATIDIECDGGDW